MSQTLHLPRSPDAIYPFDARGVAKRFRHAAIFGALDALASGETMRFVNDHDPLPLLNQLASRYGDAVTVRYVQRDPGAIAIDFVKNWERMMSEDLYPKASKELVKRGRELAPETFNAFQAFSRQVFADGALLSKTKELIAVAVAHVTQCPYCIRGHTERALSKGATGQELMEAIWVAAEMRAGAAYAHSVVAIDAMHSAHT